MKLQISNKRIIPDAVTVWSVPGPEVDVVMDLKNLTFRPESITQLYVFHVIDHMFPDENIIALKNWRSLLTVNSTMHLLNDDFEYLARAFVGGDISIDLFNEMHNHPCQCTTDNLIEMLKLAGFNESEIVKWYSGSPDGMTKQHFEFILTAKKI